MALNAFKSKIFLTKSKKSGLLNTDHSKFKILTPKKMLQFEYILKKHGENTNKPSIQIYVNKIENRIIFKIKDGYCLELLTK